VEEFRAESTAFPESFTAFATEFLKHINLAIVGPAVLIQFLVKRSILDSGNP
jgi:hypothetical protein